jgi:hypothetical protein
LLSEEKARAAAQVSEVFPGIFPRFLTANQERIVDMAEQLLEKDRLREILAAEVCWPRNVLSACVTHADNRLPSAAASARRARARLES